MIGAPRVAFTKDDRANSTKERKMTPEQVKLVQSSFKKVEPIAEQAGDIFYSRLFEIAPEVRPMFPDEMSDQKSKLMSMLSTAVSKLHQVDLITTEQFKRTVHPFNTLLLVFTIHLGGHEHVITDSDIP